MTAPTQPNQTKQRGTQNQQGSQATSKDQQQNRTKDDDLHNTGAQAKAKQQQAMAGKGTDRDIQQRPDAPKQGQNN